MPLALVLVALLLGATSPQLVGAQPPPVPQRVPVPAPASAGATDSVFADAAQIAWRQFERLWVPETGLAFATFDYDKLTTWDIGSVMGALYSGRILGFVDSAEYARRMRRTLTTLAEIPLVRNAAYHKIYDAKTARLVGRGGVPSRTGYAWSATDLGRFLVWLKIVERGDSALAPLARRVAARIDPSRILANGYMYGEEVSPSGRTRRFQEGRIGYEQYAARGFTLWGHDADSAASISANAAPMLLYGIELARDTRGLDRLTSEPFVLLGLEIGWTPAEARLARNLLETQAQRFRDTRIVTIASEDAVGIAPHYFYYYCVYCSGRAFGIETVEPGSHQTSPRWVSTKATFGWHALLPSQYTELALQTIAPARSSAGWSSGVMERTGTPTRSYDLNTAAVILEAAAYRKLGRPLLDPPPTTATAR